MIQQQLTEATRILRINDALAQKIMGWSVRSTRYYSGPSEYILKPCFDPMRDLRATMRLINHALTLDRSLCGKLTFATNDAGAMVFSAGVMCAIGSGIASGPSASQALTEAVAMSYGIGVQGGAQ